MPSALPTVEPSPGTDRAALIFDRCLLPHTADATEEISASFTVAEGSIAIIQADDVHHEHTVAAAIAGLLPPLSGQVRFQGHDWQSLSRERANALRGRIGTVFSQDIWSPYRTVMDGIILPQLHHTRRPLDIICSEATRICSRLGLPGIPQDLPDSVSDDDRTIAGFARALLGDPDLIVIHRQSAGLPPRLLQRLTPVLLERRERGAAVVWFDDGTIFDKDRILPVHRKIRLPSELHQTASEN